MKRADVNKDPARARKRAVHDLRCAAKKLAEAFEEHGKEREAASLLRAVEKAQKTYATIDSTKGVAAADVLSAILVAVLLIVGVLA